MAKMPKMPKGFSNQVQDLQNKLLAAQEELSKQTVTASAGGGAVTVTLTGDQQCTEVHIDPALLQDADAEMLQDMLLTALNKALEDSRQMASKYLNPFSP